MRGSGSYTNSFSNLLKIYTWSLFELLLLFMFPFCKICSVFILSHSFEVTDRNHFIVYVCSFLKTSNAPLKKLVQMLEIVLVCILRKKDVYFITSFKCLLVEFMTSIRSLNAKTCWFSRISFMWIGISYIRWLLSVLLCSNTIRLRVVRDNARVYTSLRKVFFQTDLCNIASIRLVR